MKEFDAIRPYEDREVQGVTERLLRDEEFIGLVARLRFPRLSRYLSGLTRVLVRAWLRRSFGHPTSVEAIQGALYPWVEQLIRHTTTNVTFSGLEDLPRNQAHLFVSNHRDIVFDPLLVNYLLRHDGRDTTRIAIGDNLLENRQFAELMRLNKSFVVQRQLSSPREMRNAFQNLSAFIHHSIAEQGASIWIAQREGRAKDGIDRTDPAIIKMFHMSQKRQGVAFEDAMRALHIVPVSISYEWDPCDIPKARELEARAQEQSYRKSSEEDTDQILAGLTGNKGHVHVHFGRPIQYPQANARSMAGLIDQEIQRHYRLHPSNLSAWRYLNNGTEPSLLDSLPRNNLEGLDTTHTTDATDALQERFHGVEPALQQWLYRMYANPVNSALECDESSRTTRST